MIPAARAQANPAIARADAAAAQATQDSQFFDRPDLLRSSESPIPWRLATGEKTGATGTGVAVE